MIILHSGAQLNIFYLPCDLSEFFKDLRRHPIFRVSLLDKHRDKIRCSIFVSLWHILFPGKDFLHLELFCKIVSV